MKKEYQNWNPELKNSISPVLELLSKYPEELILKELKRQLGNRFVKVVKGIESYKKENVIPQKREQKVIWQEGSTKLLAFNTSKENAPAVICVPSLINRSYILDLSEKRSLIKYLQHNQIHGYLIDWGEPDATEYGFGISHYIGRINKIIEIIRQKAQKQVSMMGYCMGGVLALAAAQQKQKDINKLVLMATPWDFHVKEFARIKISTELIAPVKNILDTVDIIPGEVIQSIFYYLFPSMIEDKFNYMLHNTNDEKKKEQFFELELWLNDNISMVKNVGKTCFVDWVHKNQLQTLQWKINSNQTINPTKLNFPTLCVIPKNDKIVPLNCAMPLTKLIKQSTTIHPNSGHIKMIVGNNAKEELWQPLVQWIKNNN